MMKRVKISEVQKLARELVTEDIRAAERTLIIEAVRRQRAAESSACRLGALIRNTKTSFAEGSPEDHKFAQSLCEVIDELRQFSELYFRIEAAEKLDRDSAKRAERRA